MKRAGMIAAVAMLGLGWALASPAHAQEYRFKVPEVQVVLTVQPDASVIIDYRIRFENQRVAHAIDVVDVGMPTKDYDVLSASVNGKPLNSWPPSTYIEIGPEVHLEPYAIAPGTAGVFECKAHVTGMVFEDRTDEGLASLRFTPTWFGEKYVVGETDLLMVVKFPPGVHPDAVVWHSDEKPFFEKGILDPDNVAFVSWKERYRLTGPMMFGCSFPRAVMERVEKSSRLTEFLLWWKQNKGAQRTSGVALLLLFSICFLLLTRGTGFTVLLVCLAAMVYGMVKSPLLHLYMWMIIPAMGCAWYVTMHRRRPRYLPALARVESGKICRGLTPPEAAVLMEMPLSRVLGMVLTALLGKGVIRIMSEEPMKVEPVGSRPVPNIVQLPDGRKVTLEPYEVGFLDTLSDPSTQIQDMDFSKPLERFIGLVKYKLSGFDPEASRSYYRSVTDRAWDQVDRQTDPQAKDALAGRHLNWLTMSDDYKDRMEEQERQGWHYRPIWYPRYRRDRDTDWLEDIGRFVRGPAERSSRSIAAHPKGLDLSAVDHFTLKTLQGLAESSGRGGGGGCACAGCACACACAGGGR